MSTPLVILHGWNSQINRWEPFKTQLVKAGYQIYLPALPQDLIRNTHDYSLWLKDYTKNFPNFCLLGHSFGGQIAVDFTAVNSQRVKKLILVNSAGIRNKLNFKRLIFKPVAKVSKWFFPDSLKRIFYRLINETDYFKASPVMKQTLKKVVAEDQQINLAKISCPTLIVWGQNDTLTPLSDGRLIHRLIPNSQLKVLENARHGLPFTHAPALASLVLNFIKQ
ncbi:MAG: alpha/beta hydrolase [Candidatus Beckwithbacteria bacterium]|nr:alpha/beta hydrolase [Candidatus Beckwithbacteria bacterium]